MEEDTTNQKPITTHPIQIKAYVLLFLMAALLMMYLLMTQNPGEGGPVVILSFLLLLFLGAFSVLSIGVQVVARTLRITHFSWVRRLYTSISLAGGIVLLVGLQTLRQLQIADIVLITLFELTLNFYLLRRF